MQNAKNSGLIVKFCGLLTYFSIYTAFLGNFDFSKNGYRKQTKSVIFARFVDKILDMYYYG